MITELVILGSIAYGMNRIKRAKVIRKGTEFEEVMREIGILNKSEFTFQLRSVKETEYGFSGLVHIPQGLSFEKLESIKATIEDSMKCLVEMEKDRFTNYARIKIITNPLNNLHYKVEKTEPYELFIGYDFSGNPVKINMNKFPHLLIGGATGTGKSREVFIILTTLLNNHSDNQIKIYLTQIRKKDLNKFKKLPQVKWCADSLAETQVMFERVDSLIQRRSHAIDAAGVENIYDYNKKAPTKMVYVYVFADEFSFYMPDAGDSDKERELKAQALASLKKIIVSGRSVGVFVICSVQRTTIENIGSTIKSQMSRLTFRTKSELDSINIIGIGEAKRLKNQECILDTDNYYYIKTPYIDNKIIHDVLKTGGKEEKVEEKPKTNITKYTWKAVSDNYKDLEDITYRGEEKKSEEVVVEKPSAAPRRRKKNGVIRLEDLKNVESNG